jgi:hypothetical protein
MSQRIKVCTDRILPERLMRFQPTVRILFYSDYEFVSFKALMQIELAKKRSSEVSFSTTNNLSGHMSKIDPGNLLTAMLNAPKGVVQAHWKA